MVITPEFKEALLVILFIALIVMVVCAIIVLVNLTKTLKKADSALDDIKRISVIAADRAERTNEIIDNAADTMLGIVSDFRAGSFYNKITSIVRGVNSARGIAGRMRVSSSSRRRPGARRAVTRRGRR